MPEMVLELAVIRTEPSSKKRGVRATDDNVERARLLARELDARLFAETPAAICVEAQSWPRNASAAIKVGIAWGVIVSASEAWGIPMLQVTPMGLKKAVTGSKTATKQEVQRALERRWPGEIHWPAYREHAADALGAIVACLDDDLLRMARQKPGAVILGIDPGFAAMGLARVKLS